MKYQHMNPEEAFQAYLDLGAREMYAMHWGTFDLTDEPIDYAPKALAEVLALERAEGADTSRVHVLAVGERRTLD